MTQLTLISFDACPFVQRAAILLHEQGREYEIKYIDLRDKPDWFLELSPHGKVPVLLADDQPVFESAVILEFLDETSDGARLLPASAIERAHDRMWISYISGIMSKGWSMQAAPHEETARSLAADLESQLAELIRNAPALGPFWRGSEVSMVDVALAPILQRFTWAETLEPSLGMFDNPELEAWRDVLLARPSASASIVPDLEERSAAMLKSIGSWVARNAVA